MVWVRALNLHSTLNLDCSHLKQSLLRDANVILILKVGDPWGNLNSCNDPYKKYRPSHKPEIKLIPISMLDLARKSNHQDIRRFMPANLAIGGDAEATLPDLTATVKRAAPDGAAVAQRRATDNKMHDSMRARAPGQRTRQSKLGVFVTHAVGSPPQPRPTGTDSAGLEQRTADQSRSGTP